ncbi:MAG: HAMP domain-containing histidine kinase [Acidobacteria bacterium]|nr:HAMP domain-containing histidine kinase [Acidobacteriota bacterium]
MNIATMMSLSIFDYFLLLGLLLIVVFFFLFMVFLRKNRWLKQELTLNEKKQRQLNEENSRQQTFRAKTMAAIADPAESVQQLRLLLDEICSWLQWKAVALIFRDKFSQSDHHFPYPESCLDPAATMDQLENIFTGESRTRGKLQTVRVADFPAMMANQPAENLPLMTIYPFVKEAEIQGGLMVFQEKSPDPETEADIRQLGHMFESLVRFKLLQSEIGLLNNRTRMLSTYLVEISSQEDCDSLLENLHRFFSEHFVQMNVAALTSESPESLPELKKGKLLDSQLIHRLFPILARRFEAGERFLYAATRDALREAYSVEPDNERINAVLLLPLLLDEAPAGHLVFECAEPHPFGPLELETLLLMADLTSLMMKARNRLELQELDQRRSLKKIRDEIKSLTEKLAEKDMALHQQQALQEMASFNSIFSLVQGAKVSLTNLRGFLRMTQETGAGAGTNSQEWVRNCLVETDRLESILQKFDLIQVITDKDYPLQIREIQAGPFFEKVLAPLKSKLLSKKTGVEFNHDPNVNVLKIDPAIMSQALQQFILRLLDFLAGGKMLLDVQHKGGSIQVVIRYTPEDKLDKAVCERLETLFAKEFQYLLLQKVYARHEGKLDHTINPEKGTIVRGLIPSKK